LEAVEPGRLLRVISGRAAKPCSTYEARRDFRYNFILVMTNTGMRPSEAKNLRWRDIATQTDRQGRKFCPDECSREGEARELVAPESVATYLYHIRENVEESAKRRATGKPKPPSKRRIDRKAELPDTQRSKEPDDFVFVTDEGERGRTLYYSLIERLLIESKLQHSSSVAAAAHIVSGTHTPRSV